MAFNHDELVRKAAGTYKRRCRWADYDELVQEGQAAAMEAMRHYDPKRGEVAPYLWAVVMRTLGGFLVRARSAVTLPRGHTFKELPALAVPFDLVLFESALGLAPQANPEDITAEEAWARRVRDHATALTGTRAVRQLALSVLRGEAKPRELAKRQRVPVRSIYKATAQLRAELRESGELAALAAEVLA